MRDKVVRAMAKLGGRGDEIEGARRRTKILAAGRPNREMLFVK